MCDCNVGGVCLDSELKEESFFSSLPWPPHWLLDLSPLVQTVIRPQATLFCDTLFKADTS